MGLNSRSALKQPLAAFNAAAYVGPHNLAFEMARTFLVPGKFNPAIDFALKNSPELRNRNAGEFALLELSRERSWIERIPVVGKAGTALVRAAFYPLQKLDQLTAISTWNAAYRNASKSGLSHADSVIKAERVVRLTQSSGMAKDQSFVVQRGEGARFIHQFQSFMINDWNLIKHDIIRSGLIAGGGGKTAAERLGKRAQAIGAMLFMIQAAMIEDWISAGFDWDKASEGGLLVKTLDKVPLIGRALSQSKFGGTTVPGVDTAFDIIAGGSAAVSGFGGPFGGGELSKKQRENETIRALKGIFSAIGVPGTSELSRQIRKGRKSRVKATSASSSPFSTSINF